MIPHLRDAEHETDLARDLIAELAASIGDMPAFLAELGIEISDAERRMFEEPGVPLDGDEDQTGASDGSYWTSAQRTGQGTSFRIQRQKQFYPIYIDEKTQVPVRAGKPLLPEEKGGRLPQPSVEPVDGLLPVWPIDRDGAERVWCFEHERMNREIELGNLRVGRFNPQRKRYALTIRRVRATEARFRERTVWWHPSYDAGSNGTTMLTKILGRSGLFNFPKSVYAVRDTLATAVKSRPDALILDFFAGSATTVHATMLLNALDGGHRRCLAVTNNEVDPDTATAFKVRGVLPGDSEFEAAGIFEQVAVPRIRAVVTGRRADGKPLTGKYKWAEGRDFRDGFDENVEFLRLEYLDPDEVSRGKAFEAIAPLLWMKAGLRGQLIGQEERPFVIPEVGPYAVLFDINHWQAFADGIRNREAISHAFVVTDSLAQYQQVVSALPPTLQASMLYEDYLRNFEINVGGAP